MHSQATVAEALRLRDEEELGARRIAARVGVPLPTVRDWYAGKVPHHSRLTAAGRRPTLCPTCEQPEHRLDQLGPAYVHLLGLYLGDGNIAAHRRGVFRLRIFLDKKYPGIVDECAESMQAVAPCNSVHALLTPSNCYSVSSYSRSWPCLFPQHGPGPKHTRPIFLADWQQRLAERWPEHLLKGLFCSACDCLGLRWTASFPTDDAAAVSIYVSRKADVARLDEFVGPKR